MHAFHDFRNDYHGTFFSGVTALPEAMERKVHGQIHQFHGLHTPQI